ncbi:MAG TPA: MATE family efflux transporter, partial [candidate division Zixibacteria bacterium]|nr:MATE family efflux transporter [candidate division Zixibacteria bacterium]
RTAWTATGIGVAFTGLTTAALLLLPDQLARLFTDDADVIDAARDYLVIVGVSQMFMAIEIIIDGAFSGAGDTLPPMVVSVPGSLARIPVAYVLSVNLGFGVAGVWWAISVTTIVRASIMAYWFSRNAWQRKEV